MGNPGKSDRGRRQEKAAEKLGVIAGVIGWSGRSKVKLAENQGRGEIRTAVAGTEGRDIWGAAAETGGEESREVVAETEGESWEVTDAGERW